MREVGFRAFLRADLSDGSGRSYVAYLSRVERVLGVDLDDLHLSKDEILRLRERLIGAGVPPTSVSNCGSALVTYAKFAGAKSAATPENVSAPAARLRPDFIRSASVGELMRTYGDVLDELRERRVLRTGNGPIGDYAEQLFASSFGWVLTGNSAAGYDATDERQVRYQIKARRITSRSPSRQLGALRRLPQRPFDVLAAVLFDENFGIVRAALVPFEIVATLAKRTEHTNSWRLMLTDRVWSLSGVKDVTETIRTAVEREA